MRGQKYIRQFSQRVRRRQRFLLVAVQTGENIAPPQARDERLWLDQRAARNIDQHSAGAQLVELGGTQKMPRTRCEAAMQRYDVGRQHFAERGGQGACSTNISAARMLRKDDDPCPRNNET